MSAITGKEMAEFRNFLHGKTQAILSLKKGLRLKSFI